MNEPFSYQLLFLNTQDVPGAAVSRVSSSSGRHLRPVEEEAGSAPRGGEAPPASSEASASVVLHRTEESYTTSERASAAGEEKSDGADSKEVH